MANIDKAKLRDLALNGNGTASPYVPLLCSELAALLDEIDNLAAALDEACDIAEEYVPLLKNITRVPGYDERKLQRVAELRKVGPK